MADGVNNKKRSAEDLTNDVHVSKIFCKEHENVVDRIHSRFSDSNREENKDLLEIKRKASVKRDTIEILMDAKAFCAVEEDKIGDIAGVDGYGTVSVNQIFYEFKNEVDVRLKHEKAAFKALKDEGKQLALLKTMKKFNKDLHLGIKKLEDDEVNDVDESEVDDDGMD